MKKNVIICDKVITITTIQEELRQTNAFYKRLNMWLKP